MNGGDVERTYSDFGIGRSLRQVRHALRQDHASGARIHHEIVAMDGGRLRDALGADELRGLHILEVGPGQSMERALWYGRHNEVTAVDLDEIVEGFDLGGYRRMLRANGIGRVVKTLGRRLLVGGRAQKAWAAEIGATTLNPPRRIQGDFCDPAIAGSVPGFGTFDAVVSWSVFEHLPEPRTALENAVAAVRPGGAVLISIHNYTSINGHHDIRAFTGRLHDLPRWGHLRPAVAHEIHPSAWLNELRIADWNELIDAVMPGATVHLDMAEHPEVYGPLLVGDLREELADYSEEELLTVNMVIVWRKPEG